MTDRQRLRGPLAVLGVVMTGALAFLFGHGCGGVSSDRQDAINQATTATCNRYQYCGAISKDPGASYATVGDCQTDWKAKFTNQWTEAQCQGHVDRTALDTCIGRINTTMCTSIVDVLTTFYVVCSTANVCDIHDAGTG